MWWAGGAWGIELLIRFDSGPDETLVSAFLPSRSVSASAALVQFYNI